MSENIYRVYVDESGMTQKYNDNDQPTLCLTGIIAKKNESEFNKQVVDLLDRYGVDYSTEIHTSDLLRGESFFFDLKKDDRNSLLYSFIQIGIDNIDYIHSIGMLKPYVKDEIRENLKKRNLDPFLNSLYFFMIEIDLFFYVKLQSSYEIYFDRSDFFDSRTKKLIVELMQENPIYYSLKCISKHPDQIDSKVCRYIQLADAIGFIMAKYRQFEVTNYNRTSSLYKHESFIKSCYELVKPKLIPRISVLLCRGIFNPKELSERDFSHLGNWLTKTKTDEPYNVSFNKDLGKYKENILLLSGFLENCLLNYDRSKMDSEMKTQIVGSIKKLERLIQDCTDSTLRNRVDSILQGIKKFIYTE